MTTLRPSLGLFLVLILPLCSQADIVEYSNGSISGSTNGWSISAGTAVSNSFIISNTSTLSSASFGTWAQLGVTPDQIDWSIGTTAFGSEISSGTSSATNTLISTHQAGNVFQSTMAISGSLTPGTYYFTLQNASSNSAGYPIYWDQNSGASTAYSKTGSTTSSIGSESFTLYSASTAVPEPSTILMAGGLSLFASLAWMQNRQNRSSMLKNSAHVA